MKTKLYLPIVMIVALLMPTSIVYATQPTDAPHFRLSGNAGWVDTRIALEAGQQLSIQAYGKAITARINLFDSGSVSGPDGQINICPNYEGAPACAMENAPYGALVGKIGEAGEPFLIGSSYILTAMSSGDLYLAANDLLPYYGDNHGNYMVFFNY